MYETNAMPGSWSWEPSIASWRDATTHATQGTFAGSSPSDFNSFEPLPRAELPAEVHYDTEAKSKNDIKNGIVTDQVGEDNKNKRPIIVAVFGQTGVGKTSFIKAVSGKDVRVGHDLNSCEFCLYFEKQAAILTNMS
jgi:hypothetical protein